MATANLIDVSAMLPAALTAPDLTEAQFLALCQKFPDALLEYTPEGTVLIMPPTDPITSSRVLEVGAQLRNWARVHGGITMGPDGGFRLPGGSRRSPDASWFDSGRWKAAAEPGLVFPPFSPEFVIEVRSPHDRIRTLRNKMLEYLENGVELAWLIEPAERRVTIYRPGAEPETLSNPTSVHGEGPMAGFELQLDRVF